jgi:diguanylate cyclase (GGDEF)-like protein/PAS domain S-box-containing protein
MGRSSASRSPAPPADAEVDTTGRGAPAEEGESLQSGLARLERRVARERAARKQAEGLIEEKSRELWEQRNASDVVIQLAPDYTITWASPSLQDILGWSPADLTGTTVAALIHPDDLAQVLHARDHLIDGVGSVEEFRFQRADGVYVWMAGRSRQLRDHAVESGLGWVVALRDVDELVLARRAVMADRARLRATLDSLLDPHVLLVAVRDESGCIVDFTYESANDAACGYMRMPRADLEGARLLDLLPGQAGSGMLAMYADAVESGEPLSLDDYAYPHEMFGDERRYDIRAVRVGDALSFTWRDVTDRFAAAQALAEQEREYRLLAENAGDIVVRTRSGIALWISPSSAEVLGYPPEDLVGTDLTELIHPADLAMIATARQTIQPGQTSRLRYRLRTRAGTFRWVQANTRIWVDDEGRHDGTVATIRDIDDEMNALRALEDSEERYRLLADNSSDVVMHVRDGLILWVSPALDDMLGWTPSEWIGTLFDDVIHRDDLGRLLQARAHIHAGATIVDRFRARGRDGVYHWIETHARPYLDVNGAWDGAVVSFRTVDAEVRAELELEHRAQYDELTGLVNRNELFERFASMLTNQRRPGDYPAAIFIDVDEFKGVNDTRGHAAGDELLRTLASRVTCSVRSSDVVARVGGDELVVILAGVHDLDEAVSIAEKIRTAVRAPIPILDGTLNVTVSIGVTTAKPGETVDVVIARADAAMYKAKGLGRDRVLPIA